MTDPTSTIVIALASFIVGILYCTLVVAMAALTGGPQTRPGSVIPGPESSATVHPSPGAQLSLSDEARR